MHFPYDEISHRMGIGWAKTTHVMGKVWLPILSCSRNASISHIMRFVNFFLCVINSTCASFVLFSWKFSHRRNTYKLIKKSEYFHVQHRLFAMSDKKIYIKNPYAIKKRKIWNKPTKLFPNKWKRKLVKSNKGSYSH